MGCAATTSDEIRTHATVWIVWTFQQTHLETTCEIRAVFDSQEAAAKYMGRDSGKDGFYLSHQPVLTLASAREEPSP